MKNKRKVIRCVLIVLYVGFILWITIFNRTQSAERIFKGLFWEIQVGYWKDIFLNILLFVPLGFLLGNKKCGFIYGIVLSIAIEVSQYIFKLGFCEVDDVVNNSIGVVIGYMFVNIMIGERGRIVYKRCIKRILDLIISLIGLPFFGMLFVIIAPIIYFEDKGPVFYNAPRLGHKGKIFKMYKFRSMRVNAPDLRNEDGSTYNGNDDPRVTHIGRFMRKTSIDETPQLLNILRGDMSLIGPRPDLPDALEVFNDNEIKKLDVLPGITGYSQAYHRNLIELHERFKEDVYYAEHVSFALDCRIFFQTIKTVVLRKGIYRDEKGKKVTEKK